MDKDAIDRLRYLCTVPTHSLADLEELQGLVEELIEELIEELYDDSKMCGSCMYYVDDERACLNPHAPYHENIDPHAEACWGYV